MPGTGNMAAVAGATTASSSSKPKSTLHMNKTILKTVSVFLASGKRNSSNQSRNFDTTSQSKRRLRKQKMDELSGKINPKLLESLRKKTKFTNANGIDIYSVVVLVIDIIVLQIKFWFTVVQSIIQSFLPKEEASVQGEAVLITGTGHGIGKELALQYGKLGAKVICWDINDKNNQQTVKEIKASGGKAFAYTCNVMNRNDINDLADKIKKEHGFISIVVNNAGIMPCHPLLQTTETEIRNMFEINVIAHFWIIQAFLPEMIERNQGNIVALSSCAGLFGLPNLVPYCGTKFAVRGIMSALTEELRHQNPNNNIKLTSIYPYMVDTGLCKKPRYRFPNLMKLVTPSDAAASIISAQRTGLEEASIPRHFVHVDKIGRLLPRKAMRLVNDFLDTGVDSDL